MINIRFKSLVGKKVLPDDRKKFKVNENVFQKPGQTFELVALDDHNNQIPAEFHSNFIKKEMEEINMFFDIAYNCYELFMDRFKGYIDPRRNFGKANISLRPMGWIQQEFDMFFIKHMENVIKDHFGVSLSIREMDSPSSVCVDVADLLLSRSGSRIQIESVFEMLMELYEEYSN